MADRVPLEKPSLSHTSQEPEGLAWAQIGTDLANGGRPAQEKTSAAAGAGEKEQEEDAGSEVDLRVDEDAEPEEESEVAMEPVGEGEADEGEEEAGATEGESGDKKGGSEADEKKRAADEELEHKKKTNSLDPRSVRARVFVGHLNTNRCAREDVEKLFEPHGKIVGVSLQNGYGFVQFEDEEGARRAIKEVHGQQFCGMRIGTAAGQLLGGGEVTSAYYLLSSIAYHCAAYIPRDLVFRQAICPRHHVVLVFASLLPTPSPTHTVVDKPVALKKLLGGEFCCRANHVHQRRW